MKEHKNKVDNEGGILWLELTNGCNLQCVHCYSDSYPGSDVRDKLDHKKYVDLICDGVNQGFTRLQLIGGEPLLYKKIDELIVTAADSGYEEIEIFSNLTFIPYSVLSLLDRVRIVFNTSLYSYSSDTHNKITGKEGSHELTLGNIEKLKRLDVEVNVAFVEMEDNFGHFERTAALLKDLTEEDISIYKDQVRAHGRGKEQISTEMFTTCGACSGKTACVGYDGVLYPCIMAKMLPIGSVLNNSLSSLLKSDENDMARKEIRARATATQHSIYANCGPQGVCGPSGIPNCGPQGMCGPSGVHCLPDVCSPRKKAKIQIV